MDGTPEASCQVVCKQSAVKQLSVLGFHDSHTTAHALPVCMYPALYRLSGPGSFFREVREFIFII